MAVLTGKNGSVKIGADTMNEVQSWSLDIGHDMLEDTALGDNWKSYVAGLGEWTSSIEVKFDLTDAAQSALHTAMLNGTSITVKLYTNATNYYTGTGYISSFSIEDPVEDLISASLEIQGSGTLSYN